MRKRWTFWKYGQFFIHQLVGKDRFRLNFQLFGWNSRTKWHFNTFDVTCDVIGELTLHVLHINRRVLTSIRIKNHKIFKKVAKKFKKNLKNWPFLSFVSRFSNVTQLIIFLHLQIIFWPKNHYEDNLTKTDRNFLIT